MYDVVAGLGGRPVTRAGVRALVEDVIAGRLDPSELHFLDLDEELVERELVRQGAPASIAEHLRHNGWVSSQPQQRAGLKPETQEA